MKSYEADMKKLLLHVRFDSDLLGVHVQGLAREFSRNDDTSSHHWPFRQGRMLDLFTFLINHQRFDFFGPNGLRFQTFHRPPSVNVE